MLLHQCISTKTFGKRFKTVVLGINLATILQYIYTSQTSIATEKV
jgi:hypothetical protein